MDRELSGKIKDIFLKATEYTARERYCGSYGRRVSERAASTFDD
jgi:hypothetical protein